LYDVTIGRVSFKENYIVLSKLIPYDVLNEVQSQSLPGNYYFRPAH